MLVDAFTYFVMRSIVQPVSIDPCLACALQSGGRQCQLYSVLYHDTMLVEEPDPQPGFTISGFRFSNLKERKPEDEHSQSARQGSLPRGAAEDGAPLHGSPAQSGSAQVPGRAVGCKERKRKRRWSRGGGSWLWWRGGCGWMSG